MYTCIPRVVCMIANQCDNESKQNKSLICYILILLALSLFTTVVNYLHEHMYVEHTLQFYLCKHPIYKEGIRV